MKKKIITLSSVLCFGLVFSQIGINTPNPQQIFHVDGAKDNPSGGIPSLAQTENDMVIDAAGNIGLGTLSPTSKLEINSGNADVSGLKFTNLTSTSPVSSGATLGVDDSGNIVTVQGSSFTPAFGRELLVGANINITAGTTNYNVFSFTLPTSGTYLITYSLRAQVINTSGETGQGFATGFLSTAPSAGNAVPNTEILLYAVSAAQDGGTGTGNLVITIANPTTYYVGVRSSLRDTQIINNINGRSSVSYVKITP
ncbi:hypothetical protein [Chryseobacterium lathyri]|uniref:C1q domain-containing protein n=1 Tax=Chryseobacterium lathyri TaxID=395933 RepID=A0ABT9SIF1_9FLAO|nr:hypothetical protein [Chryseobacterium lathyri]MDP9959212.1 hypothetical protein [Chryseobacterium lathyri]